MNLLNINSNLVDLHKPLMHFAYFLTSNKEDAEDLFQDTIVKTIENKEKFRENTNFKAWIFTIMKNIFINDYRKHKNRITIEINEEATDFISEGTFDELYDYKLMNTMISKLDKQSRFLFGMYISQYKYEEIAEEMNIPIGTVKSKIHYIRLDLKKSLNERSIPKGKNNVRNHI